VAGQVSTTLRTSLQSVVLKDKYLQWFAVFHWTEVILPGPILRTFFQSTPSLSHPPTCGVSVLTASKAASLVTGEGNINWLLYHSNHAVNTSNGPSQEQAMILA